jgi:hypothetical protein
VVNSKGGKKKKQIIIEENPERVESPEPEVVSPVPLQLQQDVVEAVPNKTIPSSSVKNDKDNIFAELKSL